MKSKLVLCSMVLGCSMGLMAQQSSTPSSAPGTTPPTFPSDQSGSQAGQSGSLGSNSNATQDQSGQQNSSQSSSTQMGQTSTSSSGKQKVEGCLSGTDGNYSLVDKAGTSYQLQGENSELAKHLGQEVRIEGTMSAAGMASTSASSSSTGSEASASTPSSSSTGSGNTLTVQKVKKISSNCSATQGAGNSPKQ